MIMVLHMHDKMHLLWNNSYEAKDASWLKLSKLTLTWLEHLYTRIDKCIWVGSWVKFLGPWSPHILQNLNLYHSDNIYRLNVTAAYINSDLPRENQPSLHLVVFQEILFWNIQLQKPNLSIVLCLHFEQ